MGFRERGPGAGILGPGLPFSAGGWGPWWSRDRGALYQHLAPQGWGGHGREGTIQGWEFAQPDLCGATRLGPPAGI